MAFGDLATLLTNFDGVDQNPLSDGGNWAILNTSNTGDIQRVSNQWSGTAAFTGARYWTPATFGPDLDVYCTFGVKPANGGNFGIHARQVQVGGANTNDGYQVACAVLAGTDNMIINRIDNGIGTNLLVVPREFAAGEKLGMRLAGSAISMYVFTGGSWLLLGSASDATYSAAGAIAIQGHNTTMRGDDLFVGPPAPDSGAAASGGAFDYYWHS